jgi:hypothetical protein
VEKRVPLHLVRHTVPGVLSPALGPAIGRRGIAVPVGTVRGMRADHHKAACEVPELRANVEKSIILLPTPHPGPKGRAGTREAEQGATHPHLVLAA